MKDYGDKGTSLATQPAQQQEPSFYRHEEDGHLMKPERAKFLGFDLNDLQALYTSPPAQRTWVGLTDEDIASLDLSAVTVKDAISDVRAVEAKLKEKNA